MQDLPTGTVTFLFTDIEGSTRLLERLGERYEDVQGRHDAIIRSAIAVGDGRELSTEGDSFFAVFPTPAGAVRGAVHAQRELAGTAWPDGAVVQVRMGLLTGDETLGGGNYLGLDINRAPGSARRRTAVRCSSRAPRHALVERNLPGLVYGAEASES